MGEAAVAEIRAATGNDVVFFLPPMFMNHVSGAVVAPEARVVQVGDAIWQRAERRGLVQGAMWPVRVAGVLVLAAA